LIQKLTEDIFGASSDEEEQQSKKDQGEKEANYDFDDDDLENQSKKRLTEMVSKKKTKKRRSKEEKEKDKEKKRKKRSKKSNEDENVEGNVEEDIPEKPPVEKSDFDLVLESLKRGHRRRSTLPTKNIEEIEDMVLNLINTWRSAAEEDIQLNQENQPALSKVKYLSEITSYLSKKYLHEYFLNKGILSVLCKWLEPLPDRSLPNLKVREGILMILQELSSQIYTSQLKESGLGKAVMQLYKHPHETTSNRKICKTLIEQWIRPIFGLSTRYTDLKYDAIEEIDQNESTMEISSTTVSNIEDELDKKSKNGKERVSVHARIPDKVALDFKVMPKSKLDPQNFTEKLPKRNVEKQMYRAKRSPNFRKNARAIEMSIEGRHLSNMD